MYKKLLYIITLLLLLTSCGVGRSLKKADESYARGEYFNAAGHYKKAYSRLKPKERKQRGEVAYKMGECYRLINYTVKAKGAYMNAIRYKYQDSISYYYLAEMLRKNGEYKAAEIQYQRYLEFNPTSVSALNGLQSCALAAQWKANPTRHIIRKNTLFTSRRSEYSPMFAGTDPDVLYLTSTRNEAKGSDLNGITGVKSADIFLSKRDEKKQWQKPKVIESDINSEFEDGACCFSPDGQTMYFTRCRRTANVDVYAEIYSSQRTGANWGAPQKCIIINDSLSSVAHPAVSPAGDYLYFTSDMPGGYGGLDIWRINFTRDGLGFVDNLGPEVNSAGDEMFPTFSEDGTLYFSSNGHPGMGGLDIFKATLQPNGKWHIENMKHPVNSQADDFGMTFEPGTQRGFFSSNRGDASGKDHIYSFELPEVIYTLTGWVYDREGDPLSESLVTIVGDNGTYLKVNVKNDGSFTQRVDPDVRYVMLASCKGYLNNKQELETDTVQSNKEYELEFPLSSITRPVLIENIFYEFDRADLTDESAQSLDELIQLLTDNPYVTIELGAHCDYFGNDAYNLRLSQRRAESVVRYLVAGGISADRLTPKGYGEEQPKTATRFTLKSAPFLKEGDVLTEEFIKNLPPEEQEICNAINRRTEFKVLRTTYGLK
ncbi:hypothetical protein D0T50_10790 [Bacteroides sp. 214]|uniref:PorE family type IX secretion system protein n=1 Tax=Bacteroides sp. 214 TaxID=2302935 RepID=UPI0013D5A8BB|nr:OmpA family protein [Bacteroides sp. 214]NDW13375.1 hypothetical protein [Bacteroides sp. 214]